MLLSPWRTTAAARCDGVRACLSPRTTRAQSFLCERAEAVSRCACARARVRAHRGSDQVRYTRNPGPVRVDRAARIQTLVREFKLSYSNSRIASWVRTLTVAAWIGQRASAAARRGDSAGRKRRRQQRTGTSPRGRPKITPGFRRQGARARARCDVCRGNRIRARLGTAPKADGYATAEHCRREP